jgi:hypothetical protein
MAGRQPDIHLLYMINERLLQMKPFPKTFGLNGSQRP